VYEERDCIVLEFRMPQAKVRIQRIEVYGVFPAARVRGSQAQAAVCPSSDACRMSRLDLALPHTLGLGKLHMQSKN